MEIFLPCAGPIDTGYLYNIPDQIQIDYSNNDSRSTDSSIVPGNITSVMMSNYFPGHPLPDTNYTITVVAINEGGHGTSNISTCKFILLLYTCSLSAYPVFT